MERRRGIKGITMKPLGQKELDAVSRSTFGRTTGLVKRLVFTARSALLQVDDVRDELRRFQEGEAERNVTRPDVERLLVVLHRDGFCEVFGRPWHAVVVGHLPDVAPADSAEEYMLSRIPVNYRELYAPGGPGLLATGHCRGCLDRTTAKLLRYELEGMKLIRAIEESAC